MAEFFKLAALVVVVVGGSLLTLWLLATGSAALAGLAAVGMAVAAVAVIVFLARDTRRADHTAG